MSLVYKDMSDLMNHLEQGLKPGEKAYAIYLHDPINLDFTVIVVRKYITGSMGTEPVFTHSKKRRSQMAYIFFK